MLINKHKESRLVNTVSALHHLRPFNLTLKHQDFTYPVPLIFHDFTERTTYRCSQVVLTSDLESTYLHAFGVYQGQLRFVQVK